MLFTPRLFVMAEDQRISFSFDSANVMQTLTAYADICYCAALNNWTLDHDLADFQLKRSDFHEWSAANPIEFGKIMTQAAEVISGKSLKEIAEENSSESGSVSEKKKKKSNVIMRLLKLFS